MGKYLKMADVFKLQLMHFNDDGSIGGVNDSDGDAVIYIQQSPSCMTSSERDNRAIYAAHAINSHDELVVEIERLRHENEALMKCRMAAREFFNCTVASGGYVKVSSANKAALDEADKASDWLEIELKATVDLVNK